MIKTIPDLPAGVLGFEVSGEVTADDYHTVVIPAVEKAAAGDAKMRMLYHVAPGFEKYDLEAMWDDTKVGLKHLTAWEKIAVVTDVGWIRSVLKAFGLMMPGEVRVFDNEQLEQAKDWLGR